MVKSATATSSVREMKVEAADNFVGLLLNVALDTGRLRKSAQDHTELMTSWMGLRESG